MGREGAARLRTDTLSVNEHVLANHRVPFGGANQSGYAVDFDLQGLNRPHQPRIIKG
ncbi:Aldehyde dehydrogenase domain protein [Sinomonas atrocyanea]|uniref:Aldehyde dehydrogenase domain protein n=1 Tax=Sinomonas atrocyanea TaxID=37927 RepID=A0A126ZZI7_9MICC|nr:hypothetical protein [Sinomonas atrocyanea]AMM30782.1 Aldehyde dehydrogenase domain protein [Sinomonas atrocyanea]GEB63828.1 hypothetical protein SAT01_12760 [Sinomonas atrocyanea]GGG65155.1 hypothetical protein GCM10007172_15790 [Sinomonas atrocyanea]